MLDRFTSLPDAWLREAELSFSRHDPDRLGFQTRFDTDDDLRRFLEAMGLDAAAYLAHDADVRGRFRVSPYRWAKVGFRGAQACDTSQYFLLDPSFHYPISTLRVFARRFGQGAHPELERFLEPALAAPDTEWGLALKSPRTASVFCRLSREALTAVFERLATAALLPAPTAARVLELTARLDADPRLYLTLDPGTPSRLAVDVEDPRRLAPVEGWLASLHPLPPRYLKCRPSGDDVHWTAYYPWLAMRPPQSAERDLEAIRAYYERTHDDYLTCVGHTFQAALLGSTPTESNLELARRAGVASGMAVLDVGCGVCGPAIDIATALDVSVDGVTLSPSQAETSRARIAEAGLGDRVRVHLGDFHRLPFDDEAFDAALLLESSSYAHDPRGLFAEVCRVLRPGGRLYVKDFFVDDRPLTAEERREVLDYDYTYRTRTRRLPEVLEAVRAAGFVDVAAAPLEGASMEHFHKAMIESESQGTVRSAFLTAVAPSPRLTRFGRWHRRSWRALPVTAAEILARRPPPS